MSFPLTTRFGADPLIDEELANKRYVDASGGGATPRCMVGSFRLSYTINGVRFQAFYSQILSVTESAVFIPIDFNFTLTKTSINVQTNTKNGSTTYGFRDDGVTIGSVAIASSTTGIFESGVLTDAVVSGSDCVFLLDTTASSSGALQSSTMTAEFEIT